MDQQKSQSKIAPWGPTLFDENGQFVYVGQNWGWNSRCAPQSQQQVMVLPMPFYGAPKKKSKKSKTDDRLVESLRERIHFLESREPEVKIVKEVVQVSDNDRVNQLERENAYLRLQLDHDKELLQQKDDQILQYRTQLQRNELSGSSSLMALQQQLVERERLITSQDAEINRLNGLLDDMQLDLQDLHNKYEDALNSHSEVSIQEVTALRSDVEVWKNKYRQKVQEFTLIQEKYLLLEAHLEAKEKGQLKEFKEVSVEKMSQSQAKELSQNIRNSQYQQKSQIYVTQV